MNVVFDFIMQFRNDMKTLPGHARGIYLQQPFSPYPQANPSSPTNHSDLSRYVSNSVGRSTHYSTHLSGMDPHEQFSGRAIDFHESVYPSPPPTGSQAKQSVPLPVIADFAHFPVLARHVGGVLDSPPIAIYNTIKPGLASPPPTLPTSTCALPYTDYDALFDNNVMHEYSPPKPSSGSSDSESDASMSPLSPLSPVSPLSPEWENNHISSMLTPPSPEYGYLLRRSSRCFNAPEDQKPSFDDTLTSSDSRPFLLPLTIPGSAFCEPIDDIFDPLEEPYFRPSHHRLIESDIRSEPPFHCSPDELREPLPLLNSPSISCLDQLQEFDGLTFDSPSSPSLRSCSSLPELEAFDDTSQLPHSPAPSILSLPGADIDDDLIPADLAPPRYAPEHLSLPSSPYDNHSLLLLDDPNDVPPPRSPSPENFTIDPSVIAHCPDPDLQKLYDLRRKSQQAERSARQFESFAMDDDGSIHLAAGARRTIKREKDKCREVSALLRLKLNERGMAVDDHSSSQRSPSKPKTSSKKPKITSMAQLVANMIFSRHDSRPMTSRRPPSIPPEQHPRSRLSQPIVPEQEMGQDESSSSSRKRGRGWGDHRPPWGVSLNSSLLTPAY